MLTFLACQNDPIPERVTFKSTPLDSVYQDLRPEVQEFPILNNQPNKIKATKGTEIFVPENSFVDVSGNPIKGEVEVKLIEAFALEDLLSRKMDDIQNYPSAKSHLHRYLISK
jgi:hypothetical protein